MLTEILDPSVLKWEEIQLMLLELLNSGLGWVLASGAVLAPVVINYVVRTLMNKLSNQAGAILNVDNKLANLTNEFQKEVKQLETTQKVMIALVTMSGLPSEKKQLLLGMIEENISATEMLAKAKELNVISEASQKAAAEADSLLQELIEKVGSGE
jgi:hypothetical protein